MGKTGSGWWTAGERTKFNYRSVHLNNELDSTGNTEQAVSAKKAEVVQGTGNRGQSYESVVASGIFYGAVCWACISAQTQTQNPTGQTGDDLSCPAPCTQWWRWETGQCCPSWRPCCITPLTTSKALIAGASSVIDRLLHLCCTKGKVPLFLPAPITTSDRLGSLILYLCHNTPINFSFITTPLVNNAPST